MSPGDAVIGFWLFSKGQFDFAEFSRLLEAVTTGRTAPLPKNAVFLDVGANIGTHTIYALNSGLFSRAVCFEPDASNFRLLSMNIAENGYADRCDLLNVALGDKAGDATLELSSMNSGDHRIRIANACAPRGRYNEDDRPTVPIKVQTLDGVLSDLNIDPASCFLHMDVQGFESHVLGGSKRFLATCRAAFTEFWPYGMDRTGGAQPFRDLASSHFTHFIDIGAGDGDRRPISSLDALFATHRSGFGTTILLLKSGHASAA